MHVYLIVPITIAIRVVSYPDPHSQLRMDYITATREMVNSLTKDVLGICKKKKHTIRMQSTRDVTIRVQYVNKLHGYPKR